MPSSICTTFTWVTEGQRWPLLLNSLCDCDKGEFPSLLNTNAYHTGNCSGMIGSCKAGEHFPLLTNAGTLPLSLKPSWTSLTLLMKCYLKLQRVKSRDKTATEPFSSVTSTSHYDKGKLHQKDGETLNFTFEKEYKFK